MLNQNAFKGEMVAHGFTQRSLAEALGISENALSSKIRGRSAFTLDEAERCCELFGITDPVKKCYIFLP